MRNSFVVMIGLVVSVGSAGMASAQSDQVDASQFKSQSQSWGKFQSSARRQGQSRAKIQSEAQSQPQPREGAETSGTQEQAGVVPVQPVQPIEPVEPAHVPQQFTRTPLADALERTLSRDLRDLSKQERVEFDAVVAFYKARDFAPLWVSGAGVSDRARALASEFMNAGAWGLDARAFDVSKVMAGLVAGKDATEGKATADGKSGSEMALADDARAKGELALTMKALLYARHARGGRIMEPAQMLNSNLDRMPKLLDPSVVLSGLGAAPNVGSYLYGLHPRHPQFENLRQVYLARRVKRKIRRSWQRFGKTDPEIVKKQFAILRARLGLATPFEVNNGLSGELGDVPSDQDLKSAVIAFQVRHGIVPASGALNQKTVRALNKKPNVPVSRLLANMEQWRWMWEDMGDLHVLANVPEFMLRVMKQGEVIHSERIVAGQISKQTSIFTRKLKHIVLRPMWRVPESIKVRELWPSLQRGGSMFRRFGLRLETKDGKRLDYRKIDWSKDDIRNYEVVQPPGRNSAMGVVKFSFPSQHTIFMHDTPDKYMFRQRQRTLSHGCLRVRNPVKLAHILLAADKGWSSSHVDQLIKSGTDNNSIAIESRIPIHLAYFTAWAKPDGSVRLFRDVYGHEKRIRLALAGKWKKIRKGRDHLAAVQPIKLRPSRVSTGRRKRAVTPSDHVRAALGGGF